MKTITVQIWRTDGGTEYHRVVDDAGFLGALKILIAAPVLDFVPLARGLYMVVDDQAAREGSEKPVNPRATAVYHRRRSIGRAAGRVWPIYGDVAVYTESE